MTGEGGGVEITGSQLIGQSNNPQPQLSTAFSAADWLIKGQSSQHISQYATLMLLNKSITAICGSYIICLG